VAQAILALVALLPAAVHDRLPAAHLIAVIAIVAVIETVWSVRTAALASVSAGRS